MVKADAYGHGAVEIAAAAESEGVALLGVATLHEGIQLRQSGVSLPIVVLSPLLSTEIDEAVAHELDPTVHDLHFAEALSQASRWAARPLRCHVEVDTGMGRTGVREGVTFLQRLTALPGLRLAGLFTHFPDAVAGTSGSRAIRSIDSIGWWIAGGTGHPSPRITPRTAPAS